MIDYNAFHKYLCELVELFQQTQSLKGMSAIARKWHCMALTKEQFFKMNLDKMTVLQVTPQYSRMVRDVIGKHDAKVILRDTIGGLATDFLREGKLSQGGDRMVQITITQPAQTLSSVADKPRQTTQTKKLPQYKAGQILFRKGRDGGMMHLCTGVQGDRVHWYYECLADEKGVDFINENKSDSDSWVGNEDLRLAKGNEVARFLGALTRDGYLWEADNVNGLFFVKGKKIERKAVEVFANDLPDGYEGIVPLPSMPNSPYRYALRCVSPVDNADIYMLDATARQPALTNAILRQMKAAMGDKGFDHIREYFEYSMPTLGCSEDMKEHTIGFVKDENNGNSYWVAKDRDVLRLLAWLAYII